MVDKAEKTAQEGEKKSERGSESNSAEKSGEVKDEFFDAAVLRSQNGEPSPAESSRAGRKSAEKMIEIRKEKFDGLIEKAARLHKKIKGFGEEADFELIIFLHLTVSVNCLLIFFCYHNYILFFVGEKQ